MKLKITSKYFYTGNIAPSKKKKETNSFVWKTLVLGTPGVRVQDPNTFVSVWYDVEAGRFDASLDTGRIALWDLVDE